MEKNYSFAVEDVQKISLEDYDDDEFAIARLGFLSNRPNSHQLRISKEVLMEYASTFLNKWLVADMSSVVDAGTHTAKEHIVGRIPKEQTVEFVEDKDGYTRAYVDAVVSKIYAKDFCAIFENDASHKRSVSVEMAVTTPDSDEYDVLAFKGVGVTVLGTMYRPSCPESDVEFVRFSEEDSDKFFNKVHSDKLSQLKTFAKERKQSMEEKYVSHPIDTSKEAMYDGEWDGNQTKQDLVKEKNYESLALKVCLCLEEGWKDREVTKLGYPVMTLHEGKWVYAKRGLSSAKAYAEKENEEEVLKKLKTIYKKLGLDKEDGKEEDKKMAKEVEFTAVDIGDMWGKVYETIRRHDAWEYSIEGIYEEDNKKFAVLRERGGDLFRLDFSLTEEGMTVADEVVAVAKEFVEKDEIKKFAEPENADKFKKFEDEQDDDGDDDDEGKEVEMSCDEMKAKMAQMQADIESRDNIIMEKDTELADLRAFKSSVEEKEKAMSVEAVMADIKEFVDDGKYKELRDEGLACEFAALDGWKNTARAVAFEASKGKTTKKSDGVWRMSGVIETPKAKNGLWD